MVLPRVVPEIDVEEDWLVIDVEYEVDEVFCVEDVLIIFVDGWTGDVIVTL